MGKFDRLFKKIDSYYLQILGPFFNKKAQNNNELSNKLLNLSQKIKNPDLSGELKLLAELYDKAILINGGYNTLSKSITGIIDNYLDDEDDPQQEEIEDTLNALNSDLRKRAGRSLNKPDSPDAIKALKEIKDKFNSEDIESEMNELPQFDFTGGVGKEEAQQGSGRGWGTEGRTYKNWITSLEDEKQRYKDLLNNIHDTIKKDKINKLIDLITQLQKGKILEKELLNKYTASKDEEDGNALAKVQDSNKEFMAKRNAIKISIRNTELQNSAKLLENEINSTRNEKDRERLKQELEIKKLLASTDKNKSEEMYWRKMLLKSMSNGNYPGADLKAQLEQKIYEASLKKILIYDYYQNQAKNISKHFEYHESNPGQRPKRKKSITFEGAVIELQQKIATQKIVVKQKITDKLNQEENNLFSAFKDRLSIAKSNNDIAAITAIAKELQKAMNAYAETQPIVINYIENSTNFINFKNDAKLIQKSGIMESTDPIPEHIRNNLKNIINEGQKLINDYKNIKNFPTLTEAVQTIIIKIEERLNEH